MKFYKTVLFLLALNLLTASPVGLLWGLQATFPLLAPLLAVNMFVLFAPGFYLKKLFSFSRFPREDFYSIHKTFEEMRNKQKKEGLKLLKANGKNSICIGFWTKGGGSLALSEDVLQSLPPEDIKQVLNLFFNIARRPGDLLFLTALSGFLLTLEKTAGVLRRWLFFKKRAKTKKGLVLIMACKTLSWASRGIFRQADKKLPQRERDKGALFLYRLDGLIKTRPPQIPLFCAPLFLTDPLTNFSAGAYVSLQPQAKKRIQALTGRYPP